MSSPDGQMKFIEPAAGLFHLQMAIVNLLFCAHRRGGDRVGSLQYWMNEVKRNTGMFHFENRTIKDFRACDRFLNHLIDAHVLAAVAEEVQADSWHRFCEKLSSMNFRKVISSAIKCYQDQGMVFKMREKTLDSRDIIYENSVLFLQHGLIYKRFANAIRSGDIGWVEHCLKYFAIWLQNNDRTTTLKNYQKECLRLVVCLQHIYSGDFRNYWRHCALVNPSGSPTGYMPCDQLCELIIRMLKDRMPSNLDPAGIDFLCSVLGPQVIVFKHCRDNLYRDVGAAEHYQHSSKVESINDVRTIAEKLMKQKAFTKAVGRVNYADEINGKASSAVDLFGLGCCQIASGKVIRELKERLINSELKDDEDEDEDEDEDFVQIAEPGAAGIDEDNFIAF